MNVSRSHVLVAVMSVVSLIAPAGQAVTMLDPPYLEWATIARRTVDCRWDRLRDADRRARGPQIQRPRGSRATTRSSGCLASGQASNLLPGWSWSWTWCHIDP